MISCYEVDDVGRRVRSHRMHLDVPRMSSGCDQPESLATLIRWAAESAAYAFDSHDISTRLFSMNGLEGRVRTFEVDGVLDHPVRLTVRTHVKLWHSATFNEETGASS